MRSSGAAGILAFVVLLAACGARAPNAARRSGLVLEADCARLFDRERESAVRCGFGEAPPYAVEARDRAIRACLAAAGAPGSGETPESLLGCARRCEGARMITPSTCVRPHGSRAAGSACALDTQCSSGFCAREAIAFGAAWSCGQCVEVALENELCGAAAKIRDLPCAPGLLCVGRCRAIAPRGAGETCSLTLQQGSLTLVSALPCRDGLFCRHGSAPTCEQAPNAGASCLDGECGDDHVCIEGRCRPPLAPAARSDPPGEAGLREGEACGAGPMCGAFLVCDGRRCVLEGPPAQCR